MMLEKLVLFDIDGTLLRTGGAGMGAIRDALITAYGTAGSIENYLGGGRNYWQIATDVLAEYGITQNALAAKWDQFNAEVEVEFKKRLVNGDHQVAALPGGCELVKRLAQHPQVLLGVLTGNPAPVAAIKLTAAGYEPADFKVGAYGNEADHREKLVELARRRAYELTGSWFRGKSTVIVGDTVHDIACARASGVSCVIVPTGDSSLAKLESMAPDHLFADLLQTDEVVKAILR